MVNVRVFIRVCPASHSVEHPRIPPGQSPRIHVRRHSCCTVANRLFSHEHPQPFPCDLFCARKIPDVASTLTLTDSQVRPIPHRALLQGRLRPLARRMGVRRETERVCHREKGSVVRAAWL
jgi:hypothetical protein